MFESARIIAAASFEPGLSELEFRRHLCERFYGNEVDVEGFVRNLQKRGYT